MANRLANETSPYLLQHKDNPVDWYPWGQEALAKAKAEDKPMLISIGYSACHWCHVMEHESFEDADTAALMNALYVNVKVDREERPDLDNLYMTAVQAMTNHGGWPLNVFVTPDGVPFYGGTYWPSDDRMGMPAFKKVLQAVHDAYANRKDEVLENAAQVRGFLDQAMSGTPEPGDVNHAVLERAVDGLARLFDGVEGGFGSAPKFPQPSVLEFLLRYCRSHQDDRVEEMLRLTLDKMAAGGMYDQVGGGFHRYSVDAVWLVPHFEKMLYDNAQLARVYLDAFRLLGDDAYRAVVEQTLDYVLREMTSPDGGFYATQDADSEGEEGKFYVWTAEEIDEVLGPGDGPVARAYWGVSSGGNFQGHTILNVPRSPAQVAAELGMETGELDATIARAREKLYAARAMRIWPGRDEKVIASWNGMMLRAFAEASRALDRDDYRAAAERNAGFVLSTLRVDGALLRVFKDDQAKIGAFLEDYANLIDGLIALYEATFTRRWLDEAVALAETMIAEFGAPDGPGFFDTAASAEQLVSRPRDLHDGATPCGSSVAISVLFRLARYIARPEFARRATGLLAMLAQGMAEQPIGFGRFLATAESYLATPREIAIAGRAADPRVAELANAVYRRFEPNAILGLVDPSDPASGEGLPFLEHRSMRNGEVTAYLCEHYACLPPVHDGVALTKQLEEGTGVMWQEF